MQFCASSQKLASLAGPPCNKWQHACSATSRGHSEQNPRISKQPTLLRPPGKANRATLQRLLALCRHSKPAPGPTSEADLASSPFPPSALYLSLLRRARRCGYCQDRPHAEDKSADCLVRCHAPGLAAHCSLVSQATAGPRQGPPAPRAWGWRSPVVVRAGADAQARRRPKSVSFPSVLRMVGNALPAR